MIYPCIRGVITEKGMRAQRATLTDIPETRGSHSLTPTYTQARCGYSPQCFFSLPTPISCLRKEETNGLKQWAESRCQPYEKPVVIRKWAGCNQSVPPVSNNGKHQHILIQCVSKHRKNVLSTTPGKILASGLSRLVGSAGAGRHAPMA